MGNVVNTRSGVGGENVVDFIELRSVKGVTMGDEIRTWASIRNWLCRLVIVGLEMYY
jgi:hypothetical protein